MRRLLPFVLAAALPLLGQVAHAAPRVCPAGLRPATTAELFFGRDMGDADQVSDADWSAFVDAEVSPRFPDGLSVSDVYGQWKSPAGRFVREPSKALFIVLAGDRDEPRRLELIRTAYKQRFRQQSVLLVEERACVAF